MADATQKVGATTGPLVFETYKVDWELFQPSGHAPSSWSTFGGVPTFPCQRQIPSPTFNDLVLAAVSKFEDLGQAGFGNLVGPIVAQNGTYVRYLTSFNQAEFDQIVGNEWYLRGKLPVAGLNFGNGALDLKTSWILMDGVPQPQRFYTRQAWVMDLATGDCSQKIVGLVGMHIVQKTSSRPQWIWSTFEHVDNVSPADPGHTGQFTFNDGTGGAMPKPPNPIPFPPPVQPPRPFNIERVKPIDPSTQSTNAAYQGALKGTIWANYELVMTQWPLQPNSPNQPGSPPNTFPGSSIPFKGGFANTTMETFDQERIGTGCMACHNLAMRKTDFLWSLEINAFPQQPSVLIPTGPSLGPKTLATTPSSAPLQQLKTLMEGAVGQ
ncbi:hypothetical protein QA645_02835 [Bradyrhizobium sp. CIAT3101]|uniref:hypothetical protein n=1 Tax=Bradyrhizobium sp. CIAT3101 TaxID=439387 RepID=UPI0024B0EE56|nr:hypothetical protein [Bradyrhizobium sp. CIAT3101]WFU81702.1 hypothetical protein QA645_02835 [Bradyrhizobium sp. CIAT3101]